jgi:hypothetical protein
MKAKAKVSSILLFTFPFLLSFGAILETKWAKRFV